MAQHGRDRFRVKSQEGTELKVFNRQLSQASKAGSWGCHTVVCGFVAVAGAVEFVEHVTDDTLERYAMDSLHGSESEPLEEHLLICPGCRERLKATDEL